MINLSQVSHARRLVTFIPLSFNLVVISVCRRSSFLDCSLPLDCSFSKSLASMCYITRWEYCSTTVPQRELRPLDPDEVVRCKQWSQLWGEAQDGDGETKKRLATHMRGACLTAHGLDRSRRYNGSTASQNNIKTGIKHVSDVLAGGTCIPDMSQGRHVGFNSDPNTDK